MIRHQIRQISIDNDYIDACRSQHGQAAATELVFGQLKICLDHIANHEGLEVVQYDRTGQGTFDVLVRSVLLNEWIGAKR